MAGLLVNCRSAAVQLQKKQSQSLPIDPYVHTQRKRHQCQSCSVHAHILTTPSRAGFAVIRLELIEPGAETCVYQAKAFSPTDQPVRQFKDSLGINMTMKTFFTLHITSCEKHRTEWRLPAAMAARLSLIHI